MAVVCRGCGAYIQPIVSVETQSMRCPACHRVEAQRIGPLWIVTGTSGVGKTTVATPLETAQQIQRWALACIE